MKRWCNDSFACFLLWHILETVLFWATAPIWFPILCIVSTFFYLGEKASDWYDACEREYLWEKRSREFNKK